MELIPQQLGARHECRLIRTARLIMRLAISYLWDDRMAHRQEHHKLVCNLFLPRHRPARYRLERVLGHFTRRPRPIKQPPQIMKRLPTLLDGISVPLRTRFPTLVDLFGIRHPPDARTFELHLVPCQRASLVRKNKLDLSELFDEGGSAAECGGVGACIVHVEIRVDERCLLELHDFHRDDE